MTAISRSTNWALGSIVALCRNVCLISQSQMRSICREKEELFQISIVIELDKVETCECFLRHRMKPCMLVSKN